MKPFDIIESNILRWNNSPFENFQGLTPTQMHHLINDTFGLHSPVHLRDDIDHETLSHLPLFRIVEEYLKIIQRDGQIKLTPLGALPKKVLVELYEKRYLLDEHIESGICKLWKEEDCISIKSARLTTQMAGLVKKVNNKLTLTRKTIKLLETNNRFQIFKSFFQAFTEKFSWSTNDGYPNQPIGQLGWAFSCMLLDKYGDQPRKVDFYALKYLDAFSHFISLFQHKYAPPNHQFTQCYGIRTFNRFMLWFGFVTVDKTRKLTDLNTDNFMATELMKNIFHFDSL